uniref:Putative ixodes 26 kDa salivary protein n=1 Tax=Ixodes ricinus TaxID=34613 RepID=A0A0K8RF98_IXORI
MGILLCRSARRNRIVSGTFAMTPCLLAFALHIVMASGVPEESVTMYPGNKNRGIPPNITIAYALDSNVHESDVTKWLQIVQEKAEAQLSATLSAQVRLENVRIWTPRSGLLDVLREVTRNGMLYPLQALDGMRIFFSMSYNPDIICLVTKASIGDGGRLSHVPGYGVYKTLCEKVVPLLLYYNKEDPEFMGTMLSGLIFESINRKRARYVDDIEKLTSRPNRIWSYLRKCNKKYKSVANPDHDYQVPLYRDELYGAYWD